MRDLNDMTDDELIAIVEEWDARRPALWADVAARKGGEYAVAFAAFMRGKGEAEAARQELRDRGVRRRRSPRTPDPAFRFEVSRSGDAVVAVADGPVRYPEPKRFELKTSLARAVAGLPLAAGEVLRGTFRGPLPQIHKTDVENRVLLNIGLSERCLAGGFAYEHDPRVPDGWACGYEYRSVPPTAPFSVWRPERVLASWEDVELPHGFSAPAIWWAARAARRATGEDPGPGPLAVTVNVRAERRLTTWEIKAMTDGVLAASHWTDRPSPEGVAVLAERLRRDGIDATSGEVVRLLASRAGANAGRCDSVVSRTGNVDPDDHLVVAGLVHVETSPGPARLTASVCRAAR